MQTQHLQGEAILRLTEHALSASYRSNDALTGAGEVDAILRTHHVKIVEPVFKSVKQSSASALKRLYRIVVESDEDLATIIQLLRNHPDVEAISRRTSVQSFS
jgi:hypothetical protein